jgi:hypothetical protein
MTVIPAQAGIHINENIHRLDSRLRGNDGNDAAINYAKPLLSG